MRSPAPRKASRSFLPSSGMTRASWAARCWRGEKPNELSMDAGKTISATLSADKPPPSHHSVRRAVIDVGTNSIKLLVADVAGHYVQPLWEDSKQTRLGSGFYETHILQPNAIEQTAQAVADFAAKARAWSAASIR